MSAQSAVANAAMRGPLGILLQSPASQFALLGGGIGYTLYPDQTRSMIEAYVKQGLFSSTTTTPGAATTTTPQPQMVPQIITIQTPSVGSSDSSIFSRSGVTSVIIYASVGAGLCWAGYVVCTTVLPESVREMMPVTKRVFEQATTALGKGILSIKKALEDKISNLLQKQEELSAKQDGTKEAVDQVSKDLADARGELSELQQSLDRCHDSLDTTQNMQSYTLRGVKLLVRCVTTFLPHENGDPNGYLRDIARYINDGDVDEEEAAYAITTARGGGGKGQDAPLARAHAIGPTIQGIPLVSSASDSYATPPPSSKTSSMIACIPEHHNADDDDDGLEELLMVPPEHHHHHHALRRANSAPRPQERRRQQQSNLLRHSQPRPTRTKAVLFSGGDNATPEMVDIHALLGH